MREEMRNTVFQPLTVCCGGEGGREGGRDGGRERKSVLV